MSARVFHVVLAALLFLVVLTGCETMAVRRMNNGSAGEEEWLWPVPVWPKSLAAEDCEE